MRLLTIGNDTKTVKGEKLGVKTAILYLAPADIAGLNVCPWASKGCREACLYTAGRGSFNNVQQARINRTRFLHDHHDKFMDQLYVELTRFRISTERKGFKPAVRLNGTSDISWRRVIKHHPELQFYDYTKSAARILGNDLPNYWLTFSRSESNWETCRKVLDDGKNVAAVFSTVPSEYQGYRVINGDDSDVRFRDPTPVIVGLTPKGKARKDKSGFVIQL